MALTPTFGPQASGAGVSTAGLKLPKPKKPKKPKVVKIKAHVRKVAAPKATPKSPAQDPISLQVQALLAPLIQEATAAANRRAAQGQAAIQGYTQALMHALGGMNLGGNYNQAIQQQALVDAALSAQLRGGGQQQASELAGKLQAAGQDPTATATLAGQQAQIGAGAGAAGYASGSAELSKLLANAASAGTFGAKLPGIAGLGGLQATKQLQAETSSSLADEIAKINAQAPGLIQSALAQQSTDAFKQQQLDLERAAYGLNVQKAKTSAAQGAARIKVSQQQAATARRRAANSAQTAAERNAIAWYNAQTSRYRATHPSPKSKKQKFTASQQAKYRGQALTIAQNAFDGNSTLKLKPLDYAAAVREGRKAGIPDIFLFAALNQWYTPGTRGRPAKVKPSKRKGSFGIQASVPGY